jgi:CAAX prenyl protease-like protein
MLMAGGNARPGIDRGCGLRLHPGPASAALAIHEMLGLRNEVVFQNWRAAWSQFSGGALLLFLNGEPLRSHKVFGNERGTVDHSSAGWLLSNATFFGLVIANQRVGLLLKKDEQQPTGDLANPAAMHLVPLLAIITTAMVSIALSAGFNYLYPLRVLAAAGALWFYRCDLAALDWKPSLWAIVPGILLLVDRLASAANDRANAAFSAGLGSMSTIGAAAWLSFRVAGAVLTVPIAEELAFRGYLIRKLVAADFETVPATQFTWRHFSGPPYCWERYVIMAGGTTLAGMVFAARLYRRGALANAVIAHSTANALLSGYVLMTHRWFLWN